LGVSAGGVKTKGGVDRLRDFIEIKKGTEKVRTIARLGEVG